MSSSALASTDRNGAQVLVARCIDPGTCTPGAQHRICGFLEPILLSLGVRVDAGGKGRPRWLMDRVQSAGIVRQYGAGDPITTPWFERNLNLAIGAHGPEIVVFMDHTDCGERNQFFRETHGHIPSLEEEVRDIRTSLEAAEARFRHWERGYRGEHTAPIKVVLAVALVTREKAASRRRMTGVLTLDDFLEQSPETLASGQFDVPQPTIFP